MPAIPKNWTATSLDWQTVGASAPLAQAFGWTFYEHPTAGDEAPVLAVSLDHIGETGPIVYDTHDHDVPEYL